MSVILWVNVVLNRTVVVHSDSLSSAEASLFYGEAFVLWGGWGESKRERAGHDGLGIFFSIIDILMGIPSGSLCGGERQ